MFFIELQSLNFDTTNWNFRTKNQQPTFYVADEYHIYFCIQVGKHMCYSPEKVVFLGLSKKNCIFGQKRGCSGNLKMTQKSSKIYKKRQKNDFFLGFFTKITRFLNQPGVFRILFCILLPWQT